MALLLPLLFLCMMLPARAESPSTFDGFGVHASRRQSDVERRFLALPSAAVYRAHLERITRDPHPSGSPANAAVAEYLAETMAAAGLRVERYAYDAWMPDYRPHVAVALVRPIRLPLNTQEYILPEDPYSAHPDLTGGWNAYSASGDVTAG
ncbi:MAG: glutamate carboxypeptidase, partial [bacterium]|nr:glutamate carboxypeptidase [bacterium]